MYKLIATWSAPPAAQLDEFERHYESVHAPAAAKVPHLRRIVLTRTADGLEGGRPGFHRVAEMLFDSPEALAESSRSDEWAAMRADAGEMVERFGVDLTVALGWETELPLGS
ncbi:hypothetical protein PSU4_45350 [Pseudonocardia sulfidoxydans NBRC 16205]|uniref:EthD domain-containing protein n=2 Tax=Pseudonocardia sulfidoxydans TaxID=54011 RepID=A0A511DL87_9PSEU|nr:EthD family reductase [Pseudonocardia sulfidoxydans]GEL25581.1 hypothetical protein PSU4_45350 [Pseudonocardia sulfidoxydans NBRC 16205]